MASLVILPYMAMQTYCYDLKNNCDIIIIIIIIVNLFFVYVEIVTVPIN